MVNSRWVAGLSTGTRAFSASDTMVNATPANTRLGEITNELAARVCTMLVSEVEPAISAVVNSTINSAGSARNPTSISRRAHRLPNAVPISIAASAMNTRANANRPTSAIASVAGDHGRAVDTVG